MSIDVATIRKDFPVLQRQINGKPLVYLDSANTSQKPNVVIETMAEFMRTGYAPINRSSYKLAAEADNMYEGARHLVAKFINAPKANEIIFTKNATEALNLVIMSWGRANLQRGDVVLLTHMEAAHKAGAIAIVDACQWVPHQATDVQAWGADFVAFSSHKMCGPSGLGVLWGREKLLEAMPPFLGGGNMISDVRLDGFTPAVLPAKFEAGTPPIAEVVGLGAAVEYLQKIGMNNVRQHEIELSSYVLNMLNSRFGDDITIHGPTNTEHRGATFSFAFRGIHPHDISQVLDQQNVCVRAGHHCAKPLMRIIGAKATVRASFYLYSTQSDADALADALDSASDIF